MKAALRDLPLFALLDEDGHRRVAQATECLDVPEGRELVREGEPAYEFFVIESGTAEVTVAGTRRATLGPGQFFGEIGILTGRRMATVTATSSMRVLVMTRHAFLGIERDMPAVAEAVREAISQRLATDSSAGR